MTPFATVVDFYLNALQTAVGRTLIQRGPEQAILIRQLEREMKHGHVETTKQVLEILSGQSNLPSDLLNDLSTSISKLAAYTPEMLRDEIRSDTLEKSVDAICALGLSIETIGQPDMAYNLFEAAYHVSSVLQKPYLNVARKLRQLSNPENKDQYHAAIWRFATALLGDCILSSRAPGTQPRPYPENNDWLAALDAVELALNVYVDQVALQQQLCEQFELVLRGAQGTPIEQLVAIYPVQVDPRYLAPQKRRQFIEILAGARFEAGDPPSRIAALELFAAIRGQNMLDDVRLKLLGRYHGRPNITWYDLTLEHENLLHAVPLQRSLIIDINRTGELVLELTHEIAHAFCLLGPVGWVITALRVATHCCELMIELPNRSARAESGLADLAAEPAIVDLAEVQIAASYRSAVHEAIWVPWLEGTAQYVEMLADPKDDPQEILAVHEAVRSLIDFQIEPMLGESEEDFVNRYGEESSKEFENFVSQAVSRFSRLRHIGYIQDSGRRELYIFGYLLVRSVVARWEATLGRRLKPVLAAKLLLNATRNGTHSIDWGLKVDPESFLSHASGAFADWVDRIAHIDRDSLEQFFESVSSDERGHRYYWRDGKPRRVAENISDAQSTLDSSWSAFEQACGAIVSGEGLRHVGSSRIPAKLADSNREIISQLFEQYRELATLLPVGKDAARLVLLRGGRALVCPRTYIGLEQPKQDDALPRYSDRIFPLDGAEGTVESLRRACGVLGTARLHITRILDLVGHPLSPDQRPNASYVCLFLGDKWQRVTIGDSQSSRDISPQFIEVLQRRVLDPPFPNESGTLRSPATLAKRILTVKKDSHYADLSLQLSKDAVSRTIAVQALSQAFGVTEWEIGEATASLLSNARSRIDLADYLFTTGTGQNSRNHPILSTRFARSAFSVDSISGIKPFGGCHA